jgi:hypothetical protein
MFSVGVKDFLNRRSGVRLTPGLPFSDYRREAQPTVKTLHAPDFRKYSKTANGKVSASTF